MVAAGSHLWVPQATAVLHRLRPGLVLGAAHLLQPLEGEVHRGVISGRLHSAALATTAVVGHHSFELLQVVAKEGVDSIRKHSNVDGDVVEQAVQVGQHRDPHVHRLQQHLQLRSCVVQSVQGNGVLECGVDGHGGVRQQPGDVVRQVSKASVDPTGGLDTGRLSGG